MIDVTTLHGLQIFHEEMHPSIVGIGRSKEGFSVFGMMDRCLTLAVGLPLLILQKKDADSRFLGTAIAVWMVFETTTESADDKRPVEHHRSLDASSRYPQSPQSSIETSDLDVSRPR